MAIGNMHHKSKLW